LLKKREKEEKQGKEAAPYSASNNREPTPSAYIICNIKNLK